VGFKKKLLANKITVVCGEAAAGRGYTGLNYYLMWDEVTGVVGVIRGTINIFYCARKIKQRASPVQQPLSRRA
jgi:hypothetical protein